MKYHSDMGFVVFCGNTPMPGMTGGADGGRASSAALTGGPEDRKLLLDSVPRLFYAHIENMGVFNPTTSAPGLDLLVNMIVYNGNEIGFSDAYADYSARPEWKDKLAVYFNPSSALQVEGGFVKVLGEGVAFFGPQDHPLLDGVNISQFRPGDLLERSLFPGL